MSFSSHIVTEATMLTAVAAAGLEVAFAGPRLAFDEYGKRLFDEALQREYLASYGKLMWYFDFVKPLHQPPTAKQ